MTTTTDAVLRGAVKQWIADLPADERDALIAEVTDPPTSDLERGRATYRNTR